MVQGSVLDLGGSQGCRSLGFTKTLRNARSLPKTNRQILLPRPRRDHWAIRGVQWMCVTQLTEEGERRVSGALKLVLFG